jgi:hypothetical protein
MPVERAAPSGTRLITSTPPATTTSLLAGHDRLRGEVQRLLARSAGPVDRGARDALGPARGQHRIASDIARLIPDLGDTAPDHVVDDLRIDPRPLDERAQHDRGEVGGVHAGQPAVPLAHGGADRLHDHCFPHVDPSGRCP